MTATAQPARLPCCVCGAESDGVHFGAESCAACAAFFRRSVVLKKEYSCRRDGSCLSDKNTSLRCICRACRFKKCLESGMDSILVQPPRDGKRTKEAMQQEEIAEQSSPETIVLPSAITSPRSTIEPELIKKMLAAYRQLLHNRAVAYCTNSIQSMLIDGVIAEMPEVRPGVAANNTHLLRTELPLAAEYIKSMEPFQQLPPDQKLEFFKAFLCIWGGIEGSFRTIKVGGFEKKWLMMPDNSYIALDNLQDYYHGDDIKVDNETASSDLEYIVKRQCKDLKKSLEREWKKLPLEMIQKAIDNFPKRLAKCIAADGGHFELFKPTCDHMLNEIMLPMLQHNMNDAEFVALTAIASWTCDPLLSNCSDQTKMMGKAVRDQLCAELFSLYSSNDVPDPDVRLGNLLLILPALLEFARVSLENFRMVKFFDMMNYDKIMDDIFS